MTFAAPFAPLVPQATGLERPPGEPVKLRERMAELCGVEPQELLPVGGRAHGRALLAAHPAVQITESDFGFDPLPLRPDGGSPRPDHAIVFDLSGVYGLAGAPCGGIVAERALVAALEANVDWARLPTPVVRLAEAALDPSRALAVAARADLLRAEHARVCAALGLAAPPGRVLRLPGADRPAFARFGIEAVWDGNAALVAIGPPEANDRVLAAMGRPVPLRPPARRAEVVRDTRETRIVCAVDLDRAEPVRIETGVSFYDHMLDQVAKHGGFSLTLACEGDLHIEAHHTIEDCALALGDALRQALGDRGGLARFGFVAPLDEAEAAVTLDLSGRPLAKFAGSFARPMIGAYPTEMTPHVFRSIADSLRATIHVKVEGEDDHHKTEACFKAFGRALRMAIRREGDGVPSTKGVLA